VPENFTKDSYLEHLAKIGLDSRLADLNIDDKEGLYKNRLQYELSVIKKMGFSGYFLIVWDFIKYAKENGIPVGPGRGSGAGSLVAYALNITDIEPIRYKLLFERFLNPDRVSLPDFDIDFCMNRRPDIINYVTSKYGKNNVSQIITYGTLKAKAAIRDVGRVMGLPYKDVDQIAKTVPLELNITLDEALKGESDLAKKQNENPIYKELIDYARELEGLPRHAGTHAAGIVISEKPLWEHVPLYLGTKDEIVTQFAKDEIEEIGLVKFDFLGLKTLTVIHDASKLIKENHDKNFNIDKLPLDDKKTYKLISQGKTVGVFQLESPGFKELVKKIKPDCLEDIIASVALYRPGPIGSGMLDDFWKRKHRLINVTYPHPSLEPILKETYGTIVYQEQVMSIASTLSGFSMGEADILRRAMGKKKPEEMKKLKETFIKGALQNKIPSKKAEEIFDLLEYFAGYGFNKSHSAAYALIAYETAYLKTHYPLIFMASLLNSEKDNIEKFQKYQDELTEMNIKLLPPDLNKSNAMFTVEGDNIRFGLACVKNIGEIAGNSIIEERNNNGEFIDLKDLLKRADLRKVNKKVLESLVLCGALDFTQIPRAQHFLSIPFLLNGNHKKENSKFIQMDLFSVLEHEDSESYIPKEVREIPEWDRIDLLKHEKEFLGIYLSGHPLDNFKDIIDKITTTNSKKLLTTSNRQNVEIAGIISSKTIKTTKNQATMAQIRIDDLYGNIDILVFPKTYHEYGNLLNNNDIIWIKGIFEKQDEGNRIIATEIVPLKDFCEKKLNCIAFKLEESDLLDNKMHELKNIFSQNKGSCKVIFKIKSPDETLTTVNLNKEFNVTSNINFLNTLFAMFDKKDINFEINQ
jgi:DNA polymerase-3 subunit alpha